MSAVKPAQKTTTINASKKLMYILLSDDEVTIDRILKARKSNREDCVLMATEYDYLNRDSVEGIPILAPMDILTPEWSDRIYQDYYDWQKRLPTFAMSDGSTVSQASSPAGFVSSEESWLVRFGNQMQVRMRFIALISQALEALNPIEVCIVGYSSNQPWSTLLLDRTLKEKFPHIKSVAPTDLLNKKEAAKLWAQNNQRIEDERVDLEIRNRKSMGRLLQTMSKHLKMLAQVDGSAGASADQQAVQRLASFLSEPDTRHLFLQELDANRADFAVHRQLRQLITKYEKEVTKRSAVSEKLATARTKLADYKARQQHSITISKSADSQEASQTADPAKALAVARREKAISHNAAQVAESKAKKLTGRLEKYETRLERLTEQNAKLREQIGINIQSSAKTLNSVREKYVERQEVLRERAQQSSTPSDKNNEYIANLKSQNRGLKQKTAKLADQIKLLKKQAEEKEAHHRDVLRTVEQRAERPEPYKLTELETPQSQGFHEPAQVVVQPPKPPSPAAITSLKRQIQGLIDRNLALTDRIRVTKETLNQERRSFREKMADMHQRLAKK